MDANEEETHDCRASGSQSASMGQIRLNELLHLGQILFIPAQEEKQHCHDQSGRNDARP